MAKTKYKKIDLSKSVSEKQRTVAINALKDFNLDFLGRTATEFQAAFDMLEDEKKVEIWTKIMQHTVPKPVQHTGGNDEEGNPTELKLVFQMPEDEVDN